MTAEQDDPVLLLAEAVVEMVRASRAASEANLAAMRDMVDAVRSIPGPVVNVAAPEVNVAPPVIENRIAPAAVNVPHTQDIRIVGLPRLDAKVRRDRQGRIDGIEEDA